MEILNRNFIVKIREEVVTLETSTDIRYSYQEFAKIQRKVKHYAINYLKIDSNDYATNPLTEKLNICAATFKFFYDRRAKDLPEDEPIKIKLFTKGYIEAIDVLVNEEVN